MNDYTWTEKQDLANREEIKWLRAQLAESQAEVKGLEEFRSKAENENMNLKKEIKVLKDQNDWYATMYDNHKCLENFLDEVFDSAHECTMDKPWREIFEDYCVHNMNKPKEARE